MTMLRCLAGALALAFMTIAASAAQTSCTTRGDLAAFLAKNLPGARVTVLGAAEASLFIASLNRLPPVTDLRADELVVVDIGERMPHLRIVLFEKGCMTRMGTLPRQVARKILNDVGRGGA